MRIPEIDSHAENPTPGQALADKRQSEESGSIGGAPGDPSVGEERLRLSRILPFSTPVSGVGFGNYRSAARPYYARHPGADRRSHAHNIFLQVAAEAGLVGLGAFCYLFGTVVLRGRALLEKLRDKHRSLWATAGGAWVGVAGFLIGGLTQDTFADSECALPMWFAVAVLMIVDGTIRAGGRRGENTAR